MNIKKFWLLSLACILITSFACLGLTACGGEHEHSYGDWAVTKQATCLETGLEVRVCSKDDSHTEEREIPALGHSLVLDSVASTSATCLVDGVKVEKCENCSHTVSTPIPAIGHTLKFDESASTSATCLVDGIKVEKCENCSHTVSTPIPAIGHTLKTIESASTSATCLVDGAKVEKCENCSYTVSTPIPAIGHNLKVDESASTSATCLVDGVKVEKCENCSYTVSTPIPANNHSLVVDTVNSTVATCVTHGKTVSKCENCSYVEEKDVVAYGHSWDIENPTCGQGQSCLNCAASNPVKTHNYLIDEELSTELSCLLDEKEVYVCEFCDSTIERVLQIATGHTVGVWNFVSEESVAGKVCTYSQKYSGICSTCNQTVEKFEETVKHTVKGAITTYATCSADGEKTFTCTADGCNYSYVEGYSDGEAHAWDNGVTNSGVTLYTCNHSEEHTYRVVSAKEEIATTVENGVLQEVGQVELQNATIAFDQKTLNGLSGNVELGADKLSPSQLDSNVILPDNLDDNAEIFNLTLSDDGNQVTEFNGKVTVRVPYELGDEDPDSIAIYYISEGEVVAIKAKYSNGYAIFETNHFSYYTVTRLSPADRCALYGHSYNETVVPATCVTAGYTLKICLRCGNSLKTNVVAAFGHIIDIIDFKDPTCTLPGYYKFDCLNDGCLYNYTEVIPELGHAWVEEEVKDATCSSTGYINYCCENENCEETYKTILTQRKHVYIPTITPPTCTEGGYTDYKCSACGSAYTGDYVKAKGHDYNEVVVAPTCEDIGYTLHTCANCGDEYKDNEKNPSHVWDIDAPTCGQGQKCLLCGADGLLATGDHQLEGGVCLVCGQGCNHQNQTTVIAPTCNEGGYTLTKCSNCGAESRTNYLPATGHSGIFECDNCDEELISEEFFANLITNTLTGNFAILLRDVNISYENYGYTNQVSMNFVELSISIDEEANIIGYGYGDLTIINEQGNFVVSAEAIIEDNILYVKVLVDVPQLTKDTDAFMKIPLNEIEGFMDIDPETMVIMKEFFGIFKNDLLPFVINLVNNHKDSATGFIKPIIENLFVTSKTSNGYLFELNYDYLREINEILATKSISEVYDSLVGDGEFEKIPERIVGLLDVKVSEILDFLTDNGFEIDAFIEKVAPIIETVAPVDVDVEELKEKIKTDAVRNLTIKDLLEKAGAEIDEDLEELIKDEFDEIKDKTLYELFSSSNSTDGPSSVKPLSSNNNVDIKEEIDKYIDLIEQSLSFKVYVTKDGNIESYEINLNYEQIGSDDDSEEIRLKLDLEIVNNYETKHNYNLLLAEAKQTFDSLEFSYDNVKNLGDEVVDNGDGTFTIKILSSKKADFDELYWYEDGYGGYDEQGNPLPYEYTAHYSKIEQVITFDPSRAISAVLPDCGDWVSVYIEIPDSCLIAYEYDYLLGKLYDPITEQFGDVTIKEVNSYKYYGSYYSSTLVFLYNVKTNEIKINDEINTSHNYVLDTNTSKEAIGCTDEGELHFYCLDCGDAYVEYYVNGHQNLEEKAVLLEGSTSCSDGALITWTCLDCGEVVSSHEVDYCYTICNYYSYEEYGACDYHYLCISSCACGEDSYSYCEGFSTNWDVMNFNTGVPYEPVYYTYCCDLIIAVTKEEIPTTNPCSQIYAITYDVYIGEIEYSPDNCCEVIRGELIETFRTYSVISNHNYYHFVELLEGSNNCEDGMRYSRKCIYCGKVDYTYEGKYHEEGFVIIDVSDTTDYVGKFLFRRCACGLYGGEEVFALNGPQSWYYSYNENYLDQRVELFYDYTCEVMYAVGFRTEKNGCMVTLYGDVLINYDDYTGEYQQKVSIQLGKGEEHNETYTGNLKGRAKTCYDGVEVVATCIDCGESRTFTTYSHIMFLSEKINLHNLGAVCGSTDSPPIEDAFFNVYSCACGKEERWEMDAPCDFTGFRFIYENSYYDRLIVCTCAVTDPQCAFNYAVKDYYEDIEGETCLKQRYQEIRLGCDENGENAQRIIVIKNGYHSVHSSQMITDTNRDSHPCYEVIESKCADCGYVFNTYGEWKHVYAEEKNYVDEVGNSVHEYDKCIVCGVGVKVITSADGKTITTIHTVMESVYTDNAFSVYANKVHTTILVMADDGIFDLQFTSLEYQLIEGLEYQLIERLEVENYVKAIVKAYYEATEYIYNYEEGFASEFAKYANRKYSAQKDGCYIIRYSLDRQGNRIRFAGMNNACNIPANWEVDKAPTCTQFGDQHKSCSRCHTVRMTGKIYPNFHDFDEYNEETGMWVCVDCGIENLNGANGMVSLEECKNVVQDENLIVVGYYIHETYYGERVDYEGQAKFYEYFSLNITLINKENPEEQVLLGDVIPFRLDSVGNYVAFSLEDVIRSMNAGGYNLDDYDVRLSFVPIGAGGYLDYGITFTDLLD